MSGLSRIARLHRMDPATWERHANPWSVWTRVPILPAAVAALLARETLGLWTGVALAGLALWAWINPRAFPPPRSTRSWAARAVIGERIWLARDEIGVPAGEARTVGAALALSIAGLPFLAWGLWRPVAAVALLGLVLLLAGKFWFLARMVRLADAMAHHPACRAWFR